MVTKKVRTEYMKKFRDPKWDSFSKCYEDCVKYRLTRRAMEGQHRPWFWEGGWETSSDSSGWSTPLPPGRGNRVLPLSVAPPPPAGSSPLPPPDTSEEVTQRLMELRMSPECDGEREREPVVQNGPSESAVANGPTITNAVANTNGFRDDTPTDNGPIDSASSDGEILRPRPRQRPRRRPPKPEAQSDARKSRAKSQPPTHRLDWSERHMEARRTPNDTHTSDACIQTGRSRTALRSLVRRSRSADLEKIRKTHQQHQPDSPWITEYMRCFSARVR